MELKGAIFDMDGVITDTAQVHFKAWKKIFDEFLEQDAKKRQISFEPFTLDDYIRYVDGLPRRDGVKYFLRSRKLITEKENLSDEEEATVSQIAEEKNALFLKLINDEGVSVFESTIQLVKELRKNKIKTAVISSSINCQDILTRANVISLFDAIVSGKALQQYHIKGKPEPDMFLEAAKRIESQPAQTVVIEDALSGIIAGRAGQFGLVIGIDRQKKWASQFKQQGADIVVSDLSEIKLPEIRAQLVKHTPLATQNMEDIEQRLLKKKIVICCDYDGTLTPIVKRPELATLANNVKDVLHQLKQYCDVAIISGRQLSDLENMVGINGLYYAGNHGLEIIGPEHFATKFEKGGEFQDDIKKACEYLSLRLSPIENCIIEDKKFSLSVHYRMVKDQDITKIEQAVDEATQNFPNLTKHYGKKVFELRPNLNWNKGKALLFILDKIKDDESEYLPIYLGDDVTDEDAFSVLKGKGIGILVSDEVRNTLADYRLHNPNEVYYFLKTILSIATKILPETTDRSWSLTYTEFEAERETLREALCTLGNGYFATRGAADEAHASKIHYPGTYFAGCYNRLKSIIAGKEIFNEDLVNMPNWLPLTFKIVEDDHNEWFSLDKVQILNFYQNLDLKKGVLTRRIRIKDKAGRITTLEYIRFVSMANPHLAVQKFILQPENWFGQIKIKSGIDGSVINSGVARYRDLNSKHLEILKIKAYKSGKFCLLARTNQSHIETSFTVLHRIYAGGKQRRAKPQIEVRQEAIYGYFDQEVNVDCPIKLEKLVTISTNKDVASSDAFTDSKNSMRLVQRAKYHDLFEAHRQAWKSLWRRCDIRVASEGDDQRIIRLHIFHLLETVSKNSVDLDIGVPARGLHGESYRGHVFWDELFIMPFYTFYFPEMAQSLLRYRYRRLNMARLLAKKAGYRGAMYPWQSGSNGDEVTQPIHLNPRSNEWMSDFSHYQRHVNAAIVFNIWRYYLFTKDKVFLAEYGAEMILEIAAFWSSIAVFHSEINRYEIHNVVGPDEYHEKYPNSREPGVNNNAYTNVMAVWSIERALEVLTILPAARAEELKEQLHIDEGELTRWADITRKMKIPFHEDVIISQFEGYEALPEFDWDRYEEKYGNIERLDRILKAENDSPDNYKVSKQADVLMIFYLLAYEELTALFRKLGYEFNREILAKNIFYYLRRTSHGSTLSKVVLASLSKYIDQDIALKYYQDVLNSDIMDTQGGTTPEGVHLGAMASCININLMSFAGVDITDGYLSFNPNLPARINRLQFNLQFQRQWLHVQIEKNRIEVKLLESNDQPLEVLINGSLQIINP